MTFTNPSYLWALSALAVPVIIHFLSRKEGRVIYLGSIRHLQEAHTRQAIKIRLNELVLLALRLALITIFVLLISGISWIDSAPLEKKWALVEPGLESDKKVTTITDSLRDNGYEIHFFQNDFPVTKDSLDRSPLDYWTLLNQLQHENLKEATIFSYDRLQGYSGIRKSLPENIRWISVDPHERTFLANITRSGSTVTARHGKSNSMSTSFETVSLGTLADDQYFTPNKQQLKIKQPDNLSVVIVCDKTFLDDKILLQSILLAAEEITGSKITVKETDPAGFNSKNEADWIFWLSEIEFPGDENQNRLVFKPEKSSDIVKQKTHHEWLITRHLTEGFILDNNLSLSVLKMLFPSDEQWRIASEFDQRTLNEKMRWSKTSYNLAPASLSSDEESKWLLSAFFIILFIERFIAYKRNQ